MRIDYPADTQLSQLRLLWKTAFEDTDACLDVFFGEIFSPDRCRCVTVDGEAVAALYWLDCRCLDRPMAYIYAVATAKRHRGRGLCRSLMENTHSLLRELGYAGCLLVPGEKGLFQMYADFGYETCSTVREFSCRAAQAQAVLRPISADEYAALRRTYLPHGGVIQEGENLLYLERQAGLYAGADFVCCADVRDGTLFCPEILGNADAAPGILTALGAAGGTFRTPGPGRDFAMYHPLSDAPAPTYFGLAFD